MQAGAVDGGVPALGAAGRGVGVGDRRRRRRATASSDRAHRPALGDRLAGELLLQRAVGRAEQRPGVAGRQLAVGEQVLDRRRQAEQAQRVGDRRAALADRWATLLVGQVEVLDQLLEGRRLLERR